MASQELIFDNSIQGLKRALGDRFQEPEVRQAFRAAGLAVDGPALPAYERSQWNGFLQLGMDTLFPGLPVEEASLNLGIRFIAGYFETPLGGALKGVLRLVGPHRTIDRLPKSLASGTNFIRASVEKVGDTDYRMFMTPVDPWPHFCRGLILEGVRASGTANVTVEIESKNGDAAHYRIRW